MHEPNKIDDLRVVKEAKRMIALSSAKACDSIAIVGPQSLEYLVALMRSGFECAACISPHNPPICAEPIDYLFICGAMRDDQLALLVGSIGRRLRRGGAIVVQLREAGQDQVISRALESAGLFELRPVFDGSGSVLAAHRLCQPDRCSMAA